MKIHKGDTVKVISGASRGKDGKVVRIAAGECRLVVEGVNLRKKHTRPRKQGQKGQVVEFPAPLSIANVMLVCPKCGKATRVGMVAGQGEKKRRACKKCGQIID